MQWIIDMILELAREQIGYFYRGDNTPNDFAIGDLVLDGAWHELDLSGIVPENAKCVNLKVNIRDIAINKRFDVRAKGQVNLQNVLSLWTQTANVRLGGVFPVNISSDRVIEYRAQVAAWTLVFLNVNGWWLR